MLTLEAVARAERDQGFADTKVAELGAGSWDEALIQNTLHYTQRSDQVAADALGIKIMQHLGPAA